MNTPHIKFGFGTRETALWFRLLCPIVITVSNPAWVPLKMHIISLRFSSKGKLEYSYSHGTSDKPLLGETIGERFDKAVERFPDREAYVFYEDGNRASFSHFKQEVRNYLLRGKKNKRKKKKNKILILAFNGKISVQPQH